MIVCMGERGGTSWEGIVLRAKPEIFGNILILSVKAIFRLVGGIIVENVFQ